MEVKNTPISELIPYARNPRKNDAAVDGVVVAGHTRLKAAQNEVATWQIKPNKR